MVKKISRIKVIKDNQIMWVSNPDKIKFWEARAKDCAARSKTSGSKPIIQITKRIYEE